MTVGLAGERYTWWRDTTRFHLDRSDCGAMRCRVCNGLALALDAASLAYDLAVAEASLARVRASVAYA